MLRHNHSQRRSVCLADLPLLIRGSRFDYFRVADDPGMNRDMPSQPLARLHATSSDRPIILFYDAKSGHAGGQPFKKIVEDSTDELTVVAGSSE
jgi:hypothetical protein